MAEALAELTKTAFKMSSHGKYIATGAALGAGVSGLNRYHYYKSRNKKPEAGGVARSAILGGISGGALGSMAHSVRHGTPASGGRRRSQNQSHSGRPNPAEKPEWLRHVKTKDDAKKAYKAQARKHHPDLGGSEEKFKQVGNEWEDFQRHHFDKLSHALFQELYHIMRECV